MPRFVLLRHEMSPSMARASHWDLMLEVEDRLRTWALAELPDALQEQPAEALGDHRLAYLDYEGPVSDDRGNVTRYDAGTYELVTETDDEIAVRLFGAQLRGTLTLRRVPGESQRWTVSLTP